MLKKVACHGGGERPLKAHLRRITESRAVNLPSELFTPIIDETYEADSRRDIMRHLRECLSEPTGKRWHRIYGGLILVETLMEKGSRTLVIETAHGHHFDLIQKVSLVEHFDSAARGLSDQRAERLVRSKASELRSKLRTLFETASTEELPEDAGLSLFIKDTASTCSKDTMSTSTGSTAPSSAATTASSDSPDVPRLHALDGHNLLESFEAFALFSPRTRLQSELRHITDSRLIDIPPEVFTNVVKASHDAEQVSVIWRHLRESLASGSRWQCIYNGLTLVENILQRGSPLIFLETSKQQGDFNLAQQIWVLQSYEYRSDWRKQNHVRKKARAVHDDLAQKLINFEEKDPEPDAVDHIGNAFSALRVWVEQGDPSAPSLSTSSRPSTDDSDEDPGSWTQLSRSGNSESDLSGSAEISGEAFFTPMQTPAPAMAMPRPQLLMSL